MPGVLCFLIMWVVISALVELLGPHASPLEQTAIGLAIVLVVAVLMFGLLWLAVRHPF